MLNTLASNTKLLVSLILFIAIGHMPAHSDTFPSFLPQNYQRFFTHFIDRASLPERMANTAGFTLKEYGRSFALVAGISKYPNIAGQDGDLKPAAEDVRKLVNYLKYYEKFDEIVVIENEDVTLTNFSFFLEQYFPRRLQQFPNSRFLFAYSGHGSTQNNRGYLLNSNAKRLDDAFENVIALVTLRAMFQRIVDNGFQVLAMINACYGGAFVENRMFGDLPYIPKAPGAHAIAAGGSAERTWHLAEVGSGSIFYETLFKALNGAAGKDGIITFLEMAAYLHREIQLLTKSTQNPAWGVLSPGAPGSFFFFNRSPLVAQKVLLPWDGRTGTPFGQVQPSGTVVSLPTPGSAGVSPPAPKGTGALADLLIPGSLGDQVLGAGNAPVTIIEYASMTCAHCSYFHETTFPEMKKKYIDTGKVRFIFREFPLDPLAAAGSMLARCAGKDKYFPMLNALFLQQKDWVVQKPLAPMLAIAAKQGGFTQQTFDECLANQKMLDGIEESRTRAVQKFNVNSVPTFFINGTIFRGAMTIEDVDQHIAAIAKASQTKQN